MACGCACPPPSEFSQTCACPSIPPPLPGICTKCKERRAQVLANQTEAVCGSCLRNSLLCKFKTAINSNCLITPSDKVLLAFSGGAASRLLLFSLSYEAVPRDGTTGTIVKAIGVHAKAKDTAGLGVYCSPVSSICD
eukprot:c27239_g1_i3 orf=43-453(+)